MEECHDSPEENDNREEMLAPNFGGVDSRKPTVDKSLSGPWKATSFLLVYEALERMGWLIMASSLVHYLRSDMMESNKIATRNVDNWVAVSHIASMFGGFLADAFLGSFRTVWIFSGISIVGFLMLTMSVSLPSLNPPAYFYFALYLLTVGTGGVWPALPTFGADQFCDMTPRELISRSSFFNWFFFSGAVGSLFTRAFLVYAKKHLSQQWLFGIPTISMFMALAFFLFGTSFYRYKQIKGKPLTRLAQVIVAAVRNRKAVLPADDSRLYEERELYDHRLAWNEKSSIPVQHSSKLYHTRGFRCLDKAAVVGTMRVVDGAARIPCSGWSVCTVTQVEELKLVLRIAPIWLGTLMFNVVKAQVSTLFVEQGQAMNRGIGFGTGSISAVFMQAILSFVIVLTIPAYELIVVPWVRRYTKDKRGFPLLQRIGIGMLFSILTVVAAALTEIQRRKHKNLSILWLCPQYVFEGLGEVFTSVGQLEFFYDQAPDSMRGMAGGLYFTNYGVALFLGNLLSRIVSFISSRNNGQSWVDVSDTGRVRLDLFFWVLAVISSVNFVIYMIFARNYEYKKVDTSVVSMDSRSFEWNMSELGLMQKPALFKHMSGLKAVKEEEHSLDEYPERSSIDRTPERSFIYSPELSPL